MDHLRSAQTVDKRRMHVERACGRASGAMGNVAPPQLDTMIPCTGSSLDFTSS
jgi:hypothetical protein